MPPLTPQITVAGNLMDLFGDEVNGTLIVQLCGFGSALPRVAGTALIAPTAPLPISVEDGAYSFKLWGNDVITPIYYADGTTLKTFYTVRVVDENGNTVQINAYQFTGAAAVDLSSAATYAPPAYPPAPTPIPTRVVFADTQTFEPFTFYVANGQMQVAAGGSNPVASVVLLDTGNGNAPVTMQISNGQIQVSLGGAGGVAFLPFQDVLTPEQWKLIMMLVNGLETPQLVAA